MSCLCIMLDHVISGSKVHHQCHFEGAERLRNLSLILLLYKISPFGRNDNLNIVQSFQCHARNHLSGIHVFILPGFPPGNCGNDGGVGSLLVTILFYFFPTSHELTSPPPALCATSAGGGQDPAMSFFLASAHFCHARNSLSGIHVSIFLDSRQKNAGMTSILCPPLAGVQGVVANRLSAMLLDPPAGGGAGGGVPLWRG